MYGGERLKGGLWPRTRSSFKEGRARYERCGCQHTGSAVRGGVKGAWRMLQFTGERTGATEARRRGRATV